MDAMNNSKIKEIMATVKSFPGMPGASARLLPLLDKPDTSISMVEEIIRYDPGLTANVLKLINSAYFGLPNKVGSIKQAIMLLGSKRMIQLVLTSGVQAVMEKAVEGYDLSPGDLWRHSVAVSIAAETLVKELKTPGADVAFTAALLHDVGKLALGSFIKDDVQKIENATSDETPFEMAEEAVIGTNHAEIGALILEKWSFPAEIVMAVRWHHAPDNGEETSSLTDIVHVADILSLMIGIGVGRDGLRYQPSQAATERLGLKPLQLELVASETMQSMEDLSDVFGLNETR